MKVFAHMLCTSFARSIAIVYVTACVITAPSPAPAAGVVGTGSPASCTDAALNAALADGGLVTFDCGGMATIDISSGTGTKIITADTTVDGGGAITISGGKRVGVFSVSGVTFAVENLTIADGSGPRDPEGTAIGGGISNSGGLLFVTHCTFSGNEALPIVGLAGGVGGGIANAGGGTLIVSDSTFTGNRAGFGGGIVNGVGTVIVTDSTFGGNSASGDDLFEGGGGGISNRGGGTLTVTDSTFTGNDAPGGAGIANGDFGQQGFSGGGPLIIANSTFIANSGGGLVTGSIDGGSQTITNSTFTSNLGGGLALYGGIVTVTNSTFAVNARTSGGGIFNSGGSVVLRNSIVANNVNDGAPGANCAGSITDGGHNLDDGTTCGFSTATGSLNNTNPQLDPAGLQDNGGATQTLALCTAAGAPAGCTAASPALDAGDQAACDTSPVNGRDQRGFVRPGGGRAQCAIGAEEPDAVAAPACTGDCDGIGGVAVDDIIAMANIALGAAQPATCPNGVSSDADADVAVIIQAVNNALHGCALG